jgi:hypothetical protein
LWPALQRSSGATYAPKQIPTVARNIQEYRYLSIRLNAWGGNEPDTRSDHPRVHHFEIINPKEQTDPAGKLLANDRSLPLAVGAREQNCSTTIDGTNNHPAFWPTVIRQRRNILDELELQDIDKKIDGRFVVLYNQGDELER